MKGHFQKKWWHLFKTRYSNVIDVKVAESIEVARCNVTKDQVENYLSEVMNSLVVIKSLNQILNMDETGFHSRIDKGRKRKCVFFKNVDAFVTYHQEAATTTLSLICCISAAGTCLPPMLVTKENVTFQSKSLNEIKNYLICRKSPSDYATKESIIDRIELVLKPYSNNVKTQIQDLNAPIFLIMDNFSIHNSEAVITKFNEIINLKIIWLPPHASHFLQMLDSSLFGLLKRQYRNIKPPSISPKIENKVVRAFHALWNVIYPQNIFRCWELTGFYYDYQKNGTCILKMNFKTIIELIRVHTINDEDNEVSKTFDSE